MDPQDGAVLTRLEGQSTPSHMANQPFELSDTKLTYATKIISSSNTPNPPNRHGRHSVVATHTTYNGVPAVLFKASDYYGVMAEECKLTIVGRFLKPRPQIDKIRSKFKELISIKGSVKIGVYDNYNVFLDFTNEDNFSTFWFRRVIEIEGQQMWLQKWSPDFKPEEDLPIAPVWVLLPGLPFHMHIWNYVKQVVSIIGTPLEMDLATRGRTRPSMAKVRVEIDFLKDQPNSAYVGKIFDDAPQKEFVQKIEFEGVPKYCKFCRKLGHNIINCRALERKKAAENRVLNDQKTADNQGGENRVLDAQTPEENRMNTVANQNGQNTEFDCQKVDETRKTSDERQKLDAKQTGRKNDGPSLARQNSVSKQNEENRILIHQNFVSK
ncbi:hypothetical protein A4A49_35878 [Nicotiana attenuata]|uniref:DUF4283 domain-containing protein n=1 Tax=Nicotiana attenuata TaxID=49451 RepID=A0A1J6KD36_NICAT|nr:hypothetical protein A4A49_35878 [Nicotiana attenuata]